MREDIKQAINDFEIKTFGNMKNIENIEKKLDTKEKVLYISPTNLKITNNSIKKVETLPGIIALTSKRIIFHYKILLNESTEIIFLDEIRSINCYGNGLTGGHIEIHTLSKKYDLLVNYKKEIMEKIQNTFIAAKNNYYASPKNVSSNADEILKYKNLLDIGAITNEEYEAKKKELLNN